MRRNVASPRFRARDEDATETLRVEPQADAVHGDDVPRLRRIGLDLAPQPRDVRVERPRRRRADAPDRAQQFRAVDRRARPLREFRDERALGRRERDAAPAAAELETLEVDLA